MPQKIFASIAVLLLISLIVGGLFIRQESINKPQEKILLGAWTEGLYDAKTKKLHPERLIEFEKTVDKKMSIAHFYRGWESFVDPILIEEFNALKANGWTPALNANPYFFSMCPPSRLPLYRAIAEGYCDEFLHKSAENLKKYDAPFYLLFAWEMNNKVHEWSVSYTGSTTKDFVNAWRYIHDSFEKDGVTNVIWVFTPNIPDVPELPYSALYPGDEYVDWVGLDGYNWGTTQSWSQWTSLAGVIGGPYETITSIAPDKPVMLAEINSADKGGNKAEWYRDMFIKQIPGKFPKIKAVVIYNEDRTKQENVNWKVDISKDSLDAFKESVKQEAYK